MIQVDIKVTHSHGNVHITEIEQTKPESEEQAKALIEAAVNRAKRRITCAVTARDAT